MAGYNLFKGKANCNSCHLDGRSTTLTAGQTDTGATGSTRPLFTCFGYANEGLPLNPRVALFYQTTPDRFGFTRNPAGFGYRDLGLGTFLRSARNPNSQWVRFAPASDGQMQTSTARNVAMTPPQCPTTEAPGPYFQKEFFHNGYAKSLKQLVHFYNTRDVSVQGHIGTLSRRKDGKGGLLADARSPEQHRYDGRQSRFDGSRGEPDCDLPANTDGWVHNTLPGHQHLYGSVHDRWFGCHPG
jgi:cytochrome c peroxidase